MLMIAALLAVSAALEFPPELVDFAPMPGNPVFEAAGPGHWDECIRERGWILHEDGVYHLWYTGHRKQGDDTRKLGYAVSADGVHWQRHPDNPVHAEGWVEDMMVVRAGDTYHMFAEGRNDETHRLSSTDRVHWTDHGRLTVLKKNGEPIPPGPFGTPTAWLENGTWHFFYERNDEAVWLATSTDLVTWTNVQDEPVLLCGPGDYDRKMIALDQVVKHKGTYYAYYHGLIPDTRPGEWTSAVAASADLVHWEKYPGNPIVGGDKSSPVLVPDGEAFRLFTMHPAVWAYGRRAPGAAAPAPGADTFTVWQLPNQTRSQMMSYVVQTAGGRLVVIDGGRAGDAAYLRAFLMERGGRVDAWYVTHLHDDHCEALSVLLADPQGLEIGEICASLPDAEWFRKVCSPSELPACEAFLAALAAAGRAVKPLSPGDTRGLDGVLVQVLGGCNPELLKNPLNNSSLVLRLSDARKSVLFLGDLGVEGGEKLLAGPQAGWLPSDVVQTAHHGQNGVGEAVYRRINAKTCLWPTPKWLWNNDAGGGEDSGHYRTKEVRGWMDALGVQNHLRMFDGLQKVE